MEINATDVLPAVKEQSFYGRLKSAASSVQSYLPGFQKAVTVAAATGCTVLYFMNEIKSSDQESQLPTYNGTSAQSLVPYHGHDVGRNFNQIACLALTAAIGSFTGTLPSLLMGTSCLATGVTARRIVPYHEMMETDIPVGNCTYYSLYLQQNPVAESFLGSTPCPDAGNLNLANEGITAADVAILAPALQQLNQLIALEMSGNSFGAAGMQVLVPALQFLSQLFLLELGSNNLGDFGITVLAPTLQNNLTGITWLSLENNSIGTIGIRALAPALQKIAQLEYLVLAVNRIGDTGIAELVQALKQQTYIQNLDLKFNKIGSAGALALSLHLLQKLTALQTLKLGYNAIGNSGAMYLAIALRTLTTLQKVDVSFNGINTTTCTALTTAVQQGSPTAVVECS